MTKAISSERKNIDRRKKLINLFICLVLGISSGLLLGSYIVPLFVVNQNSSVPPLSDLHLYVDSFEDAAAQIVGNNASDQEIENWHATAVSKGITPNDLTASESLLLASDWLLSQEKFSMIGEGKVDTIADQSIKSAKFFDGTTYSSYSLSKGMASVAEVTRQVKGSEVVTIQSGKIKDSSYSDSNTAIKNKADWNGDVKEHTANDFLNNYGILPSELFPHVISSKTILTEKVEQVNVNSTEAYKFTVTLHNEYSVIKYGIQQQKVADLGSMPVFSSLQVEYTIDKNFNILSYNTVEHYSVVYGIVAECVGTLNLEILINENAKGDV